MNTATQHILTPRRIGMMQGVGAYMLQGADAETITDMVWDTVCMRLTAYVLTDTNVNGERDVQLAVPATWWQHFKRDNWLGRRLFPKPVRLKIMTQRVSFEHLVGYPQANFIPPPEHFGKPVVYQTFTEWGWRDAES